MTSNNSPENLFVKSSLTDDSDVQGQLSAGDLLRQAREAKNLDLATLAAMLKVSESKLRALEANDFESLPAMAFTRGFAKSVCKRLGIDEKPILDLLPGLHTSKPSDFAVDLTRPLSPNGMSEGFGRTSKRSNAWWLLLAVLLIVLLALFYMPESWKKSVFSSEQSNSQDVAGQEGGVSTSSSQMTTTTLVVPTLDTSSALPERQNLSSDGLAVTDLNASSAQEDGSGLVAGNQSAELGDDLSTDPVLPPPEEMYFSAKGGSSSITVRGNDNKVLVTRTLRDGEELVVPLEKMPMKVNVGSVKFTAVKLRGQEFDLKPHTKKNTANFEVN